MSVDDALIERFIEPDPHRPADTRIAEYGVPVSALISYLRVVGVDLSEVAEAHEVRDDAIREVADAYEVPEDGVRAAIVFYKRNPGIIDAKLALNAA